MGIDIYAKWRNQTESEEKAQITGFSTVAGDKGYLREAYHGGPYVTKFLVQEAFDAKEGTAQIPAKVLRERLPAAIAIALHRNAQVYGRKKDPTLATFEDIAGRLDHVFSVEVKDDSAREIAKTIDEKTTAHINAMIEGGMLPDYAQSFVDFVVLCEKKEAETGEPVEIHASY